MTLKTLVIDWTTARSMEPIGMRVGLEAGTEEVQYLLISGRLERMLPLGEIVFAHDARSQRHPERRRAW